MKRMTPSDVRRNWFRVLDEVAGGETVVVERGGRRILIRREALSSRSARGGVPDYGSLLSAPHAEQADRWGWEWSHGGDVRPVDAS